MMAWPQQPRDAMRCGSVPALVRRQETQAPFTARGSQPAGAFLGQAGTIFQMATAPQLTSVLGCPGPVSQAAVEQLRRSSSLLVPPAPAPRQTRCHAVPQCRAAPSANGFWRCPASASAPRSRSASAAPAAPRSRSASPMRPAMACSRGSSPLRSVSRPCLAGTVVPAQFQAVPGHRSVSPVRVAVSGNCVASPLRSAGVLHGCGPVAFAATDGSPLEWRARTLAAARMALEVWLSEESSRIVAEAFEALEASGAREPWNVEEVRRFGQRVLSAHGVDHVYWSDNTWNAMYRGLNRNGMPAGDLVPHPAAAATAERLTRRLLERVASELQIRGSSYVAPGGSSASMASGSSVAVSSAAGCGGPPPVSARGSLQGPFPAVRASGNHWVAEPDASGAFALPRGMVSTWAQEDGSGHRLGTSNEVDGYQSVMVRRLKASPSSENHRHLCAGTSAQALLPGQATPPGQAAAGSWSGRCQEGGASAAQGPATRGSSVATLPRAHDEFNLDQELVRLQADLARERAERHALSCRVEALMKGRSTEDAAPGAALLGSGKSAVASGYSEDSHWLPETSAILEEARVTADPPAQVVNGSPPRKAESQGTRDRRVSLCTSVSEASPILLTPSPFSADGNRQVESPTGTDEHSAVKSLTFSDAQAILNDIEKEIASPGHSPGDHGSEPVPVPGQELEDDDVVGPHILSFYRRKCLELASQVHRRDAEVVRLRRALHEVKVRVGAPWAGHSAGINGEEQRSAEEDCGVNPSPVRFTPVTT